MVREARSGWFVEVPTSLKEEFKKLYPGRSAQRRITLAAIEWAVANHPSKVQNGEQDVTSQMQGSNTTQDPLHSQTSLHGRTLPSTPQEASGGSRAPTGSLPTVGEGGDVK